MWHVIIWREERRTCKVSILGVESLVPFCAFFSGDVKNGPILSNLGAKNILSKLKSLYLNSLNLLNKNSSDFTMFLSILSNKKKQIL